MGRRSAKARIAKWGEAEFQRKMQEWAGWAASEGQREKASQERRQVMAVFKRNEIYWYEFIFAGKRIRESAKTGSKTVAKEAGSRTGARWNGVSQGCPRRKDKTHQER